MTIWQVKTGSPDERRIITAIATPFGGGLVWLVVYGILNGRL